MLFRTATTGAPTRENSIIGLASALANRSGLPSAISLGTSSPMIERNVSDGADDGHERDGVAEGCKSRKPVQIRLDAE